MENANTIKESLDKIYYKIRLAAMEGQSTVFVICNSTAYDAMKTILVGKGYTVGPYCISLVLRDCNGFNVNW